MSDPTADDVRKFVDTDLDDSDILAAHAPVAKAWYDRAGCDVSDELETIVLARLAAVSIQFGLADDAEAESIRLGIAQIQEKDSGGEGLMSNKNFQAASAICPGLQHLDKPPATIRTPDARGRKRTR